MGNKDWGRALASMPQAQYMQVMGGTVENIVENVKNTGIDWDNWNVYKYFKQLRNFAVNRLKWESDTIPENELRLIEWNIFHYGKCAMIRPKLRIQSGNKAIRLKIPRIYRCNYVDWNFRSGEPEKICIINDQNRHFQIENYYDASEFVIFSDEFLFCQDSVPFIHIAWEYANKLHELDKIHHMNGLKMRMPFVFNSAGIKQEKDGNIAAIINKGVTIAELMRSTYGRNEPFAEIPESMVGRDGFLHETEHTQNELLNLLEVRNKLYESYFLQLGLYTNKEKRGVYTVKDLQKSGDETGDYITETLKAPRILAAKKACKMFKINMSLEVV